MEPHWAVEHLQVIRTLMERAAVYRRALAPITLLTGTAGLLASAAGVLLGVTNPSKFVVYWMAVSAVPMAGGLLLVRRQALKANEPFWSPPTRRVLQAVAPPLVTGFLFGVVLLYQLAKKAPLLDEALGDLPLHWVSLCWVVLYGCGLHAAGFFMPRGMKLFGWGLIAGAFALAAVGAPSAMNTGIYAHVVMGFFFGVLHVAYGLYLNFTEPRRSVE